ncbi:hypothetical protein EV421DRAFT_1910080 [Armillaria borealis]|uniref:Uncharacterized protein n=1 Tax=Armillaria borealis TaxID=47425 RepID=A0AA39MH00_9AGAR|nr:hypothetical protein EV421DRAFT_1910080 [Armillaria borealis]
MVRILNLIQLFNPNTSRKFHLHAARPPQSCQPVRASVQPHSSPMQKDPGEGWIDPALETLEQDELQPEGSDVHVNNEEKALKFGKKLWAAGGEWVERFRNVELMKKSP